MALKKCRGCGRQISKRAESCPQCGEPTRSPMNLNAGCLGLTILILTFAYFATNGRRNHRPPAAAPVDTEPDTLDAWVMAQQFVEEKLQAPSTASYGGILDGDYQSHSDVVTSEGDGKFRVKAWVDSENGFGAMLRSRFYLELQYLGNDKWRLTQFEWED